MDVKKMLKNYEIEVKFFDLEIFECEIMMNVPYLIENLFKLCSKLNKKEKEKFVFLNKELENKLKNTCPKTELQEKILLEIKKLLKIANQKCNTSKTSKLSFL